MEADGAECHHVMTYVCICACARVLICACVSARVSVYV